MDIRNIAESVRRQITDNWSVGVLEDNFVGGPLELIPVDGQELTDCIANALTEELPTLSKEQVVLFLRAMSDEDRLELFTDNFCRDCGTRLDAGIVGSDGRCYCMRDD